MKKEISLNETLNQVFGQVVSGANYVSKIAFEMRKSIPVAFRQLEILLHQGLLGKKRLGKRVEYFVKWRSLANILASSIERDLKLMKEELKGSGFSSEKVIEIYKNVFEIIEVQSIFKEFYSEIQRSGQLLYDYSKLEIERTVDLFMDTFAMLDNKKIVDIMDKLSKSQQKNLEAFIEISKIKYKFRQKNDPRKKFLEKF